MLYGSLALFLTRYYGSASVIGAIVTSMQHSFSKSASLHINAYLVISSSASSSCCKASGDLVKYACNPVFYACIIASLPSAEHPHCFPASGNSTGAA